MDDSTLQDKKTYMPQKVQVLATALIADQDLDTCFASLRALYTNQGIVILNFSSSFVLNELFSTCDCLPVLLLLRCRRSPLFILLLLIPFLQSLLSSSGWNEERDVAAL